MAKDLAIGYNTLRNYLDYLRLLYIIDELEPYFPPDIKTIGKTRKLFFADTGMMEAVPGKDERAIYGDPQRVGSLLETFVHNELMAHIYAFREGQWRLYHYRDGRQREIDFVLEDWEGNLYAIEVKSGVTAGAEDVRHLVWFEENVARSRPFFPIILHTGSRRYTLGNVHVVPMAFLWE
jgi:predicted AAA+ superfamily ATPase